MSTPVAFINFHGIAPAAISGMVYSLVEGTILVLLIWLVLRLLPRKNSGTQFTVWFSTLLAVTILPFLGLPSIGAAAVSLSVTASGQARYGLFMLPTSWAIYAFLAWAAIATVNLVRVGIGFWQVHRLRQSCIPLDLRSLRSEVQEVIENFRPSRLVLIGTSPKLHVPTAVGFLRPAILLPSWLVAEVSATELKHILLHEMAHLQRRDDWTNLVQKLVKAVIFFHPLVWWIDRRLSLEREVACDDAVLVQTESPRVYAQCLARVAEKSFLRRQIALAQAAVSRMQQLSLRVAQILDLDRPRTTQSWKPAIPLVAFFALLCGFLMRQVPVLVGFADPQPSNPTATTAMVSAATKATLASNNSHPARAENMGAKGVEVKSVEIKSVEARMINAGFKLEREQQSSVPARVVKHQQRARTVVARDQAAAHPADMQLASYSDYVVAHEEFVVTMTNQGAVPGRWQVQVWQLRVLIPAHPEAVSPRKT